MLLFCGIAYSGTSVSVLAGGTPSTTYQSPTFFGIRLEHGYRLNRLSYTLSWLYSSRSWQYVNDNKHILRPGLLYRFDQLYLGFGPGINQQKELDAWVMMGKDWKFTRNMRIGIEAILSIEITKPILLGTISHRF